MNELRELIEANQNCNGGGLAVGITGQYVSNRHALATMDEDKLTAGAMAKKLSKIVGKKISARELVQLHILATNEEPEYHHAGFIPGQKRMAKTYFFRLSKIDALMEMVKNSEALQKEHEERESEIISGFSFHWESDYNGKYGRKRNYKVLDVFRGERRHAPNQLTIIRDEHEFSKWKAIEGRKYYGWDEPRSGDIQ